MSQLLEVMLGPKQDFKHSCSLQKDRGARKTFTMQDTSCLRQVQHSKSSLSQDFCHHHVQTCSPSALYMYKWEIAIPLPCGCI